MASAAEQMAANLSFANFSKATELKKRLWFTIGALLVFRLVSFVPLPGIDPTALNTLEEIIEADRQARIAANRIIQRIDQERRNLH